VASEEPPSGTLAKPRYETRLCRPAIGNREPVETKWAGYLRYAQTLGGQNGRGPMFAIESSSAKAARVNTTPIFPPRVTGGDVSFAYRRHARARERP